MHKHSRPAAVHAATVVVLLLGIVSFVGGVGWIRLAGSEGGPSFALLGFGGIYLGVGEIIASGGLFYGKPWSWTFGLIASIATAILFPFRLNFSGSELTSVRLALYPFSIVGLVLPIVVIISLVQRGVRTYFRTSR